jgi:hypothetical protein
MSIRRRKYPARLTGAEIRLNPLLPCQGYRGEGSRLMVHAFYDDGKSFAKRGFLLFVPAR